MSPSSPSRRALAALGGLALAGALLAAAPPAWAEPAPAPAPEEEGLLERIARLDAAVARAEADLALDDARAGAAAEDFNTARLDAGSLGRSALAASRAADAAEVALAEARRSHTLVVSQAYRSTAVPGVVAAAHSASHDGGFLDGVALLDRLAARRDAAAQRVDAMAAVAAVRVTSSSAASDGAAGALVTVAAAAAAAEGEQQASRARSAELLAHREDLVAELAEVRETSVRAEERRQAALATGRDEAAAAPPSSPAAAAPAGGPATATTGGPVTGPTAAPTAAPSTAPTGRTPAPSGAPARGPAPPPPPAPPAAPAPAPAPVAAPPPAAPAPPPAPAPAPSAAPAPRPAPTTAAPAPAPAPPPATGGRSSGSAAGGAAAVSWARTQLGKAYLWGGEGPDAYDCSGLVLRAWQQSGVSLPHSSRLQYTRTARVDRASLRPGDLIFWASDPADPGSIHHVAIYSGDGMMIEAPNSRNVVREVPVRWAGTMAQGGRP